MFACSPILEHKESMLDLLAIKRHIMKPITGAIHRDVALIPIVSPWHQPCKSAVIGRNESGSSEKQMKKEHIDIADLKKLKRLSNIKLLLAALMVTYPSTYGVFEEAVKEICEYCTCKWRAGLYGRC
jgi:glycine cleavage system protein P-like pyridoxal-binding family